MEFKYYCMDDLLKIKDFPFKKGQLRHFCLHRKENGFDKCVRKIGKRLYFRHDLIMQWIEEYQE